MRILTCDIETAPSVAHVWGLWDQTIGLPQLLESGYVMCFAAKWYGEPDVEFYKGDDVAPAAHSMLNEADAVVTFNGVKFDIPHLNGTMVRAGLTAPSRYVNIDLCSVVKQRFRFPSNKLEYVARELLGEGKGATGGHETWIGCMAGDERAWERMEAYNRQDVLLTERLFDRLKPWINNLPNPHLYGNAEPGEITCPQCGSNNLKKRGLAYTTLSSYHRYYCPDCGRWSRGKNRTNGVDAR